MIIIQTKFNQKCDGWMEKSTAINKKSAKIRNGTI